MINTNEFDSLERDLESVFAVPVPALEFHVGADRSIAPRATARRRGWGFAGGATLAAGLVAAVAFLPGFLGGAKPVNAEELLARSAEASADLQSSTTPYHMRAKFAGNGAPDFIGETWSFGTQGNRSEARTLDGELMYGQVATPSDYWMFANIDGSLRVAHVDGTTDRLQDFMAGAGSLDSIVQNLVVDGCQAASVAGSATVAGRDAYVVEVNPTPSSCAKPSGNGTVAKEVGWATKIGGYTVWIDKETSIQLQFESRDENGAVTKQWFAEAFETGSSVDTAALDYAVPAGATVIETENYSDAKSALYAGTSEIHERAPEPTKK